MFDPESIRINSSIKTARSAVSKTRGFFLVVLAAKFWKRDISSASEECISGFFWRYFWLLNSLYKEVF